MLIAFIENAFKYGVSTEKESEIKVNIDIIEQNLNLSIQNDKVTKFSSTIGTESKTLLKGLIIHITTIYLKINDKENYYSVQLSIKL